MMQTGMFVGAQSFSANVCDRTRPTTKGGIARWKAEAGRSWRVQRDRGAYHALLLVLFNESFAATNDREGSEIPRQVVTALAEAGGRIYAVTHLYGFAHHMFEAARDHAVFLRAEGGDKGQRPFRILPGEPLATSYGDDLYREVFGGNSSSPQSKSRVAAPAE